MLYGYVVLFNHAGEHSSVIASDEVLASQQEADAIADVLRRSGHINVRVQRVAIAIQLSSRRENAVASGA